MSISHNTQEQTQEHTIMSNRKSILSIQVQYIFNKLDCSHMYNDWLTHPRKKQWWKLPTNPVLLWGGLLELNEHYVEGNIYTLSTVEKHNSNILFNTTPCIPNFLHEEFVSLWCCTTQIFCSTLLHASLTSLTRSLNPCEVCCLNGSPITNIWNRPRVTA